MDPELIKAWSAVLTALAWPITALVAIVVLPGFIARVLVKGGILHLKLRDMVDISVEPSQNMRPPSASPGKNRASQSIPSQGVGVWRVCPGGQGVFEGSQRAGVVAALHHAVGFWAAAAMT